MAVQRCCVLVLAGVLYGCSPDDVVLERDSTRTSALENGGTQFGATIDGIMWHWNVSWKDVKETPNWGPGQEPALSMPQAIQVALAEMPKYADVPDLYRMDSVEWLPITDCCDLDHQRRWIYVVNFERDERFASGARGTIRIPVLLDGRAIAGVKER